MIDRPPAPTSLHRLLVDAIPVAVFLADPVGRVAGWTGSAERLLGLSDSEAIGRSCESIFRPTDQPGSGDLRSIELPARASNYREIGLAFRADGSQFLAVFTMDRIADERGAIIGYACTLSAL
jgi:PAS domain S-box-containing protein